MSRFFASGSSSSEDECSEFSDSKLDAFTSESESKGSSFSESGSEASMLDDAMSDTSMGSDADGQAAPARKSRFLFGGSDSESDEDDMVQRVVKSQREKLLEEFIVLCEAIEIGVDTDSWIGVLNDFEKLTKAMHKLRGTGIPQSVRETLKMLESASTGLSLEEKKKLNADDARAFNSLRQRLRKVMQQYSNELANDENTEPGVGGSEEDENVGEDREDGTEMSGLVRGMQKVSMYDAGSLPKNIELTSENVIKKLQEVVGQRGRKHADKLENMTVLRKLFELASCDRHRIHVLVGIISTSFDLQLANSPMALDIWSNTVNDLTLLIDLLEANSASVDSDPTAVGNKGEDEEGLPNLSSLRGTLLSFVHRIDDEFTKALQNIDAHTTEYVDFLRAESRLLLVLQRATNYFSVNASASVTGQVENYCQVYLRILEHLYFRPAAVNVRLFGEVLPTVPQLCRLLYAHGSERIRIRAFLCHIFHLALHGHFMPARDMLIHSYLPEALHTLDIPTQILYNRALVQLGLAAFRQGLLKEAYYALQELCSTGRPKELLAQGIASPHGNQKHPLDSKTLEQERLERQRQLPPHMHLSVETIDGVFLVVSMLLEIPQQAAATRRFFRGERKLYQSRHLKRLLDLHERALFNGPPENTREHLIAAAKALANGNWKETCRLTLAVRIWDMMPNPEAIRAMLEAKIRLAGLCTFLLSFGLYYSSFSLESLETEFSFDRDTVLSIVDCLIKDYGIPATLSPSQDSSALMMIWSPDAEISPFQEKLFQLCEKIDFMAERNHETLELLAAIPLALNGTRIQLRTDRDPSHNSTVSAAVTNVPLETSSVPIATVEAP